MSSKPLEVRVPITEQPMLVDQKLKQTDLNDTPEPMSLHINDLSYHFIELIYNNPNKTMRIKQFIIY